MTEPTANREIRYIIDPTEEFRGSIYNSMTNGIVDHSQGLNFEDYKRINEMPQLISIDVDTFRAEYFEPYLKRMQGPWVEITEEQFEQALNCLPPKKWKQGPIEHFFIGECTTYTLYGCYVSHKASGKYYSALRDIYLTSEEIIQDFLNQTNQ